MRWLIEQTFSLLLSYSPYVLVSQQNVCYIPNKLGLFIIFFMLTFAIINDTQKHLK